MPVKPDTTYRFVQRGNLARTVAASWVDLRRISEIVGIEILDTAEKLCADDPARFSDIVRRSN